ncbi:MAG: recombinase family protein [Nitrososphaerota archaeon]
MKLSQWAKKVGITYRRAWQLFKEGKIPNAYRLPTGTIVVEENAPSNSALNQKLKKTAIIYCFADTKHELNKQIAKLREYATAQKYTIKRIVKETAPLLDDNRPKLAKLLKEKDYGVIIVESKDKITPLGFNYIELLVEEQGKRIECVDKESKDEKIKILKELIHAFAREIYKPKEAKLRAELVLKTLGLPDKSENG